MNLLTNIFHPKAKEKKPRQPIRLQQVKFMRIKIDQVL